MPQPSCPDQFVTWGSDLRLYKVLDGSVVKATQKEQIGINRHTELVNCITEPRYIKCVDVWRGEGALLAVGQATGRVSLLTLSDIKQECIADREFNPRYSRPCSALAWHSRQDNLLAAGFEKVRTDYGVLVWDLAQGKLSEKPWFETANGDHCTSLSWLHCQPCLVAGLGTKIVKVFDTRSNMKVVSQTATKATYGLSVDPGSDYRISGYSEAPDPSVVIWDTRNFEKPIVTLPSSHQVTKVSWCPTRQGLLANTVRDSGVIMLRDIMSWAVSQEDGEASVTERTIQPPTSQIGNIADFAWHPSKENTVLAMGTSGRFAEWTVADRLTLNWSSRHGLMWSSGGSNLISLEPRANFKSLDKSSSQIPLNIVDIGTVMQERAKRGYAEDINLADIEKYKLDTELATVWSWILQCRSPPANISNLPNTKFFGVRLLLQQSHEPSKMKQSQWIGLETQKSIRTYQSPERDVVLRQCGWEKKSQWKTTQEIARNAAIAVFNLDLKSAISILQEGCTHLRNQGELELANNLNMVSVAVSGYSCEGSHLWKEVVSSSLALLPDPALRSMFAFLTSEDDTFAVVLEENNLAFVDRIAFAVKFLSDRHLTDYLKKELNSLLSRGSLEGLLLSSCDADSLNVLQAFIDRSGDIQTVSWICVNIFSPEILGSDRVNDWIENYRTILDQWNMFGERSMLDICLTRANPTWETQLQVYIACNYCGKSISNWGRNRIGKTGSLSRTGSVQNKSKAQACPSCRKPLPRCAVCLVNMGTMSGLSSNDPKSKILTRFGEWFTWCQTCRHGGHADHLLQWFSAHTVCSVTGCACKCGSLDANCQINQG